MPLLLSKPINAHSAYAVWNIQETNDVLLSLSKEQVPEGLHPTRLAEWIVGRVLIDRLCEQMGLNYEGVTSLPTGKPCLKNSDVEISISHSFPMAAAQINLKAPCGIDLERARGKLLKIQDKFLNESETAYKNDLNKLCAIWCGKEVLYKIHGRTQLSMKEETSIRFESDDVMLGTIHKEAPHTTHKIHYEAVKDYFLAYSL